MSKHSATSKQVRKSTDRELTENELAHVSGGKPSATPKDPPAYVTYTMEHTMISSY